MPERKLYSASEIALLSLPGLPTSKSRIIDRATNEGWYFEEQKGIGGTRRMYEVPARYLAQANGGHADLKEPPTTKTNVPVDTQGNAVDLNEYVFVPRYNLSASAGHGASTEGEKPIFSMAFRRYWIEHYLHATPADLAVISVRGDSMEGVLNDRDVILLNTADTQPTSGLYVLRVEGDLIVKRVQRLPGGVLRVSSANEAYATFDVDLNNPPADFGVIGRVVWFGRQI